MSQIIEDQESNSYQEIKRKASDSETWKLVQPIIIFKNEINIYIFNDTTPYTEVES